jgi:hypothetical protein
MLQTIKLKLTNEKLHTSKGFLNLKSVPGTGVFNHKYPIFE